MSKSYIATVVASSPNGRNGPYALAESSALEGTIWFSLEDGSWIELTPPNVGDRVVLEDVYGSRKGWRTNSARLYRPEDARDNTQHQAQVRC